MRRTSIRNGLAALALGTFAFAAPTAIASEHCFYKSTMYSDGAASCQSGTQYRCDDGAWRSLAVPCKDTGPVTMSRPCDFDGVSYSTGSASCQSGTQYRCEDGRWASIGVSCPVGDSPIRAVPSGRTCMFDGATVATNSTICRAGSTFLCSDGEWMNIGTRCQ
jgi:hypothetical protein